MIHWVAYAEICFTENAHLALARAVEESGSDALTLLPDAWIIEDRKITLHIETDTTRREMLSVKALLASLLETAEQGEAVIEVPPFDRWSRRADGLSVHPLWSAENATPVPVSEDHPTIPLMFSPGKDPVSPNEPSASRK